MSLEYTALIIRLAVLVGAVLFAFILLFFGFNIVLREYNKLNTWEKMKEFLTMTAEAGLQADATKGTLSLSRTTPGVLLIGIGTALLGFCILQKYEYSSQQNPITDSTSHQGFDNKSFQFEQQVSQALQQLHERVTKLEKKSLLQDSTGKHQLKHSAYYVSALQQENDFYQTFSTMQANKGPNERELYSLASVSPFQSKPKETILDKWLKGVPAIKGKEITEQIKILLARYGNVEVKFNRILVDTPKTTAQLAKEEYGSSRFEPLLLTFNPRLPTDGSKVPIYSFLTIYYPASAPISPYRSQVSLKISGMSRAQAYDRVLEIINGILETEAYQKDPSGWWNAHFPQLGAVEFARALNVETGRQWGVRQIFAEEGDSPELSARVQYGDRKYVNILKFLNYHRPELFQNPKAALPNKTELVVLQMVEL